MYTQYTLLLRELTRSPCFARYKSEGAVLGAVSALNVLSATSGVVLVVIYMVVRAAPQPVLSDMLIHIQCV